LVKTRNYKRNYTLTLQSYESLRFCAAELRHTLPHIASALHADLVSELPLHEEIQRFEELIEMVRNELIEWVTESDVDQKLKDMLIEKLRKIGVSFTTRESLEKESFEEAHRYLQLDKSDKYIDSVVETKKFVFYMLIFCFEWHN
jgi:signal recognition particle GTPase